MRAYTVIYRTTAYLSNQIKLLRRFTDVEELIVINNGPNFASIDAECMVRGVRTIRGPCREIPSAGGPIGCRSHAAALDRMWQHEGSDYDGDILIIDFDCVPFAACAVADFLEGVEIASYFRNGAFGKEHVRFPTPVFTAIRRGSQIRKQYSWRPLDYYPDGYIDTGAEFGMLLIEHPEIKTRTIAVENVTREWFPSALQSDARIDVAIEPVGMNRSFEVIAGSWLHMGGGCNDWGSEHRQTLFLDTIKELCK